MESAQLGNSVRMPWERPNPPLIRQQTNYAQQGNYVRPSMGPRKTSMAQSIKQKRIEFLNFLPLTFKNHVVAVASEFAGTFMFLLFAYGGTNAVNTAPDEGQPENLAANPAKLLFISLCFGMSLAVNAWVFFRISGGLFNPAVTIGMMIVGALPYLRGVLVIISQIGGGIAASAVVLAIQPGPLKIATSLGGGTSVVQGLFIEMFLTAQLVFTIFMLAAEKHRATFIAPIGIGLSLFIAELMGVYYTGGSLNPARSFGPNVVLGSFESYHWIYWVGPILGALVASAFYITIKALEYETVNPEQDHAGEADPVRPTMSRLNSAAPPTREKPEVEHLEHPNMEGIATRDTVPRRNTNERRVTISRTNTNVDSNTYNGGPNLEAGHY
ncbi:aquaporin-like protein [Xylariomycetidae sp. FL0641]|nr:aquaporin-like protein [Xylariomycetidae sp. FL0641]